MEIPAFCQLPYGQLQDFGLDVPPALDGLGAGLALLDPRQVALGLDHLSDSLLLASGAALLHARRQGDESLHRFGQSLNL